MNLILLCQICCSVFAGVYNEHLIKNVAGEEVHIMVQNVFMYLDSILCNLGVMLVKGGGRTFLFDLSQDSAHISPNLA